MFTRSLRADGRQKAKATLDRVWSSKVKARDGYRCRICPSRGVHAHHLFPRARLSTRWTLANGWTLCDPCHRRAHLESAWFLAGVEQRMGSAAFEALRLLSLRVMHRPLDEVRAELLSGESAA